MPTQQRTRRWYQFSLRAILLAMLLICTFFAGRWSREGELRQEQQNAEAARKQAMHQKDIANELAFLSEHLRQPLQTMEDQVKRLQNSINGDRLNRPPNPDDK